MCFETLVFGVFLGAFIATFFPALILPNSGPIKLLCLILGICVYLFYPS